MPYLRSWLQCVSRLRSLHCHQVRSKRERHLPFAARFAGNIGPRISSPDTPQKTALLWEVKLCIGIQPMRETLARKVKSKTWVRLGPISRGKEFLTPMTGCQRR
jgi:hypothetical protein